MKTDILLDAIGMINDDTIQDAKNHRNIKYHDLMKWGAIAACLCIVVVGAFIAIRNNSGTLPNDFSLVYSTGDVAGTYISKNDIDPNVSVSMPSFENETPAYRMANYTGAVFTGTVVDYNTVYLTCGNHSGYCVLIEIQVDEVLEGEVNSGDVVTVWANMTTAGIDNPDDSRLLMKIKVGTTGIFMPQICDEDGTQGYWKDGDNLLVFKDFADYYFEDIFSFAVFEGDSGLVYSELAWPDFTAETSLAEAEEYIANLIANRH